MTHPLLESTRDVFTGFGDDPNTSIKFQLLKNRNGTDPNWSGGQPVVNRFRPLHSNDVIKQYGGREERVLVTRLLFAEVADMDALDSVQGRQSTLRVPWSRLTRGEGVKETLPDGKSYLKTTSVELEALVDQRRLNDGRAIATATFRRAVGAAAYYDYARYAEDAS